MQTSKTKESEKNQQEDHGDFTISSYKQYVKDYLIHKKKPSSFYEVIWVEKGSGVQTIDFVDYEFNGPCLFLLRPQNIHNVQKDCVVKGGVVKFCPSFFVADSDSENFILNYGVFDDIDVLPVINFNDQQAEVVRKIFNDITCEYQREGIFTEAILVSYLKILLLKIYEIKKSHIQIDCFKSPEYRRFRKFQELLDKNYKSNSAVSFYAAAMHVSTKTLGNIIQKFTRKSPQQLIKERLLLEAKRLLYFSDLSVKEIAFSLGFEDSSYFTRFFKKNTHSKPGDYRSKRG